MEVINICLLLVLLYAIPVTATYTEFHTNCTRPPPGSIFNYVSGPNTRGTLQIIFNCFSTLFLCTWTSLHLDIYTFEDKKVKLMSFLPEISKKTMYRVLLMMVALVAPEYTFEKALRDYLLAHEFMKAMEEEHPELVVDEGGWTLTHCFYARMGGFVLRECPSQPNPAEGSTEEGTLGIAWDTIEYIGKAHPILGRLKRRQLFACLDKVELPGHRKLSLPTIMITEKAIEHKARMDWLVKWLSAYKLVYFIVQVIGRKSDDLPISQLEIATIGYCVLALASYKLWMKKPYGVTYPTYLHVTRQLNDKERKDLICQLSLQEKQKKFLEKIFPKQSNSAVSEKQQFHYDEMLWIAAILAGAVFGAIHLLAWNVHFPTHTEKILWRICAIITATLLLPIGLGNICFKRFRKSGKVSGSSDILYFWGLVVYVICRLILFVEMLRTLAYLPAGAYVGTWSANAPDVR